MGPLSARVEGLTVHLSEQLPFGPTYVFALLLLSRQHPPSSAESAIRVPFKVEEEGGNVQLLPSSEADTK